MQIILREITKKDWDFILTLRNNSFTDTFFEQKKPIEKNEHYQYMEKQNSNPNFHQWIATDGDVDVAYVRILDEDVSIMVDKKFQAKGIGTIILNLLEDKALRLGIKKLKATVMIGNESSKKIFLKNNYALTMCFYEKILSN